MKTILENQTGPRRRAFTLVELLVVISIIAVLAAFLIPVAGSVARSRKISVAQSELQQIETALENYKAKYGAYPPSNTNNPAVNQLYYELSGTTNVIAGGVPSYQTVDAASTVSVATYINTFSVGGIVNCSKGNGEDVVLAKDFLPGLKSNQGIANASNVVYLVTSVGGPDPIGPPPLYQPVYNFNGNPICYNSVNPTNNPNSYDLWVDLSFSHKINRVSNWSTRPEIVN
jgi:prepilin-type N-terminal cleavage/methylation domain-containing protein